MAADPAVAPASGFAGARAANRPGAGRRAFPAGAGGPAIEDELALLLCGTQARRAEHAERIRELAALVAPESLLVSLQRQRIAVLVGDRLAALGIVLGGPFESSVAALRRRNAFRVLLFEGANRRVRDVLAERGIASLPFKGVTLAAAVYDRPELRSFGDIDVLVAEERLYDAVDAMMALGYERPRDPLRHGALPELHFALRHEESFLPPVELHWRVHWFETRFSRDLLASARGGVRPDPVHDIATLLLCYARDGFAGLALAADIAAWWDRFGAQLPAGGLDTVVREDPALRRALTTAAAVAEELVGVPAGRLLTRRPLDRRSRLAGRLANWPLEGDRDEISGNTTLIDALLAPDGGLGAFARRYVFPADEVLDDFYGLDADDRGRRALWRFLHPPKMALRYLMNLWRLRDRARHRRLPA